MSTIIEQFILLPVTPPGSLAYHAILAFTIFGALASAVNNRHSVPGSAGKRMTIGLVSILLLQVGLFIISGLAWQGVLTAESLLPVLDRTIGLLNLLIIAWLWTYPTTRHLADAVTFVLGLLLVALSTYGLMWWQLQNPAETGQYFNGSAADVLGGQVAIALLGFGILLLLFRRPPGWGFGLAMLLGLGAGYGLHWYAPLMQSDYAGAVRLAEMAFFPLLLVLAQRFPITQEDETEDRVRGSQDRTTLSEDAVTYQSLLKLCLISSPKQFYEDLAKTMAGLMKADICLLTLPQLSDRYLIFPGGYNLLTDSKVDGFSLDQRKIPELINALNNHQLLHLPSNSTAPDRLSLANALQVEQIGAILATPLGNQNEPPLLGIVLLTPFSNHPWNETDQQFLIQAAQTIAPAIKHLQQGIKIQEQLEQTRLRVEALESEASQAADEKAQLITSLGNLQDELTDERYRSTGLTALAAEDPSQPLPSPPEELRLTSEEKPETLIRLEYEQLQGDLRLVLEELANLRQSLAQADQTILELRSQISRTDTSQEQTDREVIISIAQELRQPMSSIIGYTDLLLGESVGLLGAMQRKFLERVKASSERMGGLLGELIQLSAQNGGEMDLNPVMIDLNAVIDESVSGLIAQLSEKNIALRVDLPDELPQMQADLEALQQILSNLLTNASIATPANGAITLRARIEAKGAEPGFLLLQVTDQGGGIPPKDLPRVFSRLYRADNVLIQGIGDTGVGLAIVKKLVEAHHGRIWVDTEMDQGSTFSVLLPLKVPTGGAAKVKD